MKKIDLAVQIIRSSLSYQCKLIKYKKVDNRIKVWSISEIYETPSFHATELIPLLGRYQIYFDYDEKLKKVTLNLFTI